MSSNLRGADVLALVVSGNWAARHAELTDGLWVFLEASPGGTERLAVLTNEENRFVVNIPSSALLATGWELRRKEEVIQ